MASTSDARAEHAAHAAAEVRRAALPQRVHALGLLSQLAACTPGAAGGASGAHDARVADGAAAAAEPDPLAAVAAAVCALCADNAVFCLQNAAPAACAAALLADPPVSEAARAALLGAVANLAVTAAEENTVGVPRAALLDNAAVAHAVVAALLGGAAARDARREAGRALTACLRGSVTWQNAFAAAGAVEHFSAQLGGAEAATACDLLRAYAASVRKQHVPWLVILRGAHATLCAATADGTRLPEPASADGAAASAAVRLINAVARLMEEELPCASHRGIVSALALLAGEGALPRTLVRLVQGFGQGGAAAAAAAPPPPGGDVKGKGKRKASEALAEAAEAAESGDSLDDGFEALALPEQAVWTLSSLNVLLCSAREGVAAGEALLTSLRADTHFADVLACMAASGNEDAQASATDLLGQLHDIGAIQARGAARGGAGAGGSQAELAASRQLALMAAPEEAADVPLDPSKLEALLGMGFDESAAVAALQRARGDVDRAADMLLS